MSEPGVLDASALLCYVNNETGVKQVADVLDSSMISSINYTEVFSKLLRAGMEVELTQQTLSHHSPQVTTVDRSQAEIAAVIHAATTKSGISYADAHCLALGIDQGLPIYTADRKWQDLELEFEVDLRMIR